MSKYRYYPSHIANYFLGKDEFTSYVLIKLVYFSYGFYLAINNKKLFREKIQAWKHGPVVPSIYHNLVKFGSEPVKRKLVFHSRSKDEFRTPEVDTDDKELINLLDTIYRKYGKLPESSFKDMTHHSKSPWEKVYIEGEDYIVIDDILIKEHFRSLLPIRELRPEVTSCLENPDDLIGPFDDAESFMASLGVSGRSSSNV